MKKKSESSKCFLFFIFLICVVLLIFSIIGFVLFFNRKPKIISEKENGGTVVLKYVTDFAGLKLLKAIPTSDIVGVQNLNDGEFFDFSVDTSIDEAASIDYEISITKDKKTCNLSDEDVRIYLEREESGTYTKVFGPENFIKIKKATEIGSKSDSMLIYSTRKTKTSTDNYRLRVWLSDKSLIAENYCNIEVFVNGKAK